MQEIGVVLRPAAVLPSSAAEKVVEGLSALDVSKGGVWIVNPGLWQRFDKPWDGVAGRGSAQLIGTIGSAYGTPTRYDITLYRVTITAFGAEAGWTVESLCDDALGYAGMSLSNCPRADMNAPPVNDPFRAQLASVRATLTEVQAALRNVAAS
ncbi:MAG TPA: hypothetical protein VHC43_08500 [Mycobacteriales bacterium]|nr:hypothetical protein [Mycobacteriales bacterium]